MSKKAKNCKQTKTGRNVHRLTVNYLDIHGRLLDSHGGNYMSGAPVSVDEKLFVQNGGILIGPKVSLTMPRHDVVRNVTCKKLCKERKSYSRHDR